jgi:hypothetical protein
MKYTGLFLLVALTLFACARTAPPLRVATAPEPTSFPNCQDRNVVDSQGKPDGALFVSKLVFLLKDYTLYPPISSGYKQPSGPTAANTPYAADLTAAFNAAPRFFQDQLCGLDGIFVNLNPCKDTSNCASDAADNSWGYRETLDQNPEEPAKRYISISALLWSGGAHAANFYDFENQLLYELFRRRYNVTWTGPKYGDPNPSAAHHPENTPTTTVLGSLAHEFGHVLWHDTFRPTRSLDEANNDFSRFCNGTFFDGSWAKVPQSDGSSQPVVPPPPWRAFGERSPQPHLFGDVQIDQIDDAIKQNLPFDLFNTRAYYLDSIYRKSGRWTGFFAALSADEDFIETFRFFVLSKSKPPLKNLPITIPSAPPYQNDPFNEDVPKDHSNDDLKQVLKAKVRCFASIYH